jgi:hypothetical protein
MTALMRVARILNKKALELLRIYRDEARTRREEWTIPIHVSSLNMYTRT